MSSPAQVFASRELLWNLTLRELRTRYRRSFLGWTWSLLNPLATVAIYGYVFGTILNAGDKIGDPSGVNVYALYLLCALLPWGFFSMVTNTGISSLVGNAALVRKVSFPRETLVLAQVMNGLVQFGIEMALLCIVLLAFGSPVLPWVPLVAVLMVLLAVFAGGIAMALAAISVYFRDTSYLWTIVLQAWLFATPILYSRDLIEGKVPRWAEVILDLNPIAQFSEGFRRMIYDGRAPGLKSMLLLAAVAAVTMTIGWTIFVRLSRRFAEEL